MQDKINPFASPPASFGIANVAFDKVEATPLTEGNAAFNLLQILSVSGGEIVETDYVLVEFKKGLEQIAANEAGSTGYQPLPRGVDEVPSQLLIARHSLHIRNPASQMAVRSNADFTSINTPFFFNRDRSARSGIDT